MALSHSYDLKIKKRIGFVVRQVREVRDPPRSLREAPPSLREGNPDRRVGTGVR
ncbi:MAG: hypothetical protein J3T61_02775 [Candidatus Brocadiales bacterium]|nr:hypothetical protein [Candidatus Bathyanammoxibius sp.]